MCSRKLCLLYNAGTFSCGCLDVILSRVQTPYNQFSRVIIFGNNKLFILLFVTNSRFKELIPVFLCKCSQYKINNLCFSDSTTAAKLNYKLIFSFCSFQGYCRGDTQRHRTWPSVSHVGEVRLSHQDAAAVFWLAALQCRH